MKVLVALCDIFDCTPNDLIVPEVTAGERRETASGEIADVAELKTELRPNVPASRTAAGEPASQAETASRRPDPARFPAALAAASTTRRPRADPRAGLPILHERARRREGNCAECGHRGMVPGSDRLR